MRSNAALALPCLILAAQTRVAQAQTPIPPAAQTPTLSSKSTLVVVPALVRNKAGELIFTLNADDFILTDDGVPQKLTLEQDSGGEPLALVVLIEAGAATRSASWHPDTIGTPPDRFSPLPAMIEAVAGNVRHSIAVVGFDSDPELLQNFTPNIDAVADTIHDLSTRIDGDGGSAILDALGFSLDLLRKQPPQYRRAILLLSETNDRGSKLKLNDALRAVGDTNTVIYSIAFSTGATKAAEYAHKELPTKRAPCEADDDLCTLLVRMERSSNKAEMVSGGLLDVLIQGVLLQNPDPGPAHGCMSASDPTVVVAKNPAVRAFDCLGQILPPLAVAKVGAIAATQDMQRNIPETVAHLTGGEYFKLSDARSLEQDLQAISNHIPNRYVLTFQPQSPHSGFHLITLDLPNHIDLKVSARNGYWADSTAPSTTPHP
jgi:VWFA-related protein